MRKNRNRNKFSILIILSVLFLCICVIAGSNYADAAKKKASKTSLSVKKQTVFINGTYTIPLTKKIKKATYFYTSNKGNIARVNSKGKITGVAKGTAAIKVRYKYKGEFYTVGTFKVTVVKSSLKTKYKTLDLHTGENVTPDTYLNNVNPDATYLITSSVSNIAIAADDGVIKARKAGRTALSIHEVYNKKSRTVGSIALSVTGTSLIRDEVKMAYNSRMNRNELLEDINSSSKYTFTSNNTNIVSISGTTIVSASSGNKTQTCEVTITETLSNKKTYEIGVINVTVTSDPFVSYNNQNVSIGLNQTLEVGNRGVIITNKKPKAKYTLIPADRSIISDKLVGVNYGTTTVSIRETIDDISTTLPELVKVTVNAAYIKKDLSTNGFNTTVGGDTYRDYPVECRNINATYYYESEDSSICTAGTGGMNKDQDYLIATGKKAGETRIVVYETIPESGTKNKIGDFKVIVSDGSSNGGSGSNSGNNSGATVDNPVASTLISSITFTYKGKLYNGTVSSTNLECIFGDENGNYIDYGTDFNSLTSSAFDIKFANKNYSLGGIDSQDGYEWIINVKLNDEDNTIVEVPVSLIPAELDINSIISEITVKLGDTTATINKDTAFPEDSSIKQFENGNQNYFVNFTTEQYIAAGATEYDITNLQPKYLSELDNVKCAVTENVFGANNASANSASRGVTVKPSSDDNSFWTFEISFEDGTVESFDVTLGVRD